MNNKTILGIGISALALVLAIVGFGGNSSGPLVQTVYAQNGDFVYEDYSEERFNELLGKESFSVFVHSKSCGTCAKKSQEIIDEAGQFNDGTILKMEYSEAPQSFLKEYAVTKYDTFVNFDENGQFETVKGAKVDDVREVIQ